MEAILRLPPEDRRKDRGASWGGIQDIFLHVIEDYIWWFENVPQGRGEDQFEALVGRDVSENELRSLVQQVDSSVRKFFGLVSPSLTAQLTFVSFQKRNPPKCNSHMLHFRACPKNP